MMELSDVTSPILGSFVHWLYTKKYAPCLIDRAIKLIEDLAGSIQFLPTLPW